MRDSGIIDLREANRDLNVAPMEEREKRGLTRPEDTICIYRLRPEYGRPS